MDNSLPRAKLGISVVSRKIQVEFKIPKNHWEGFDEFLSEKLPDVNVFLSFREFTAVGMIKDDEGFKESEERIINLYELWRDQQNNVKNRTRDDYRNHPKQH